MNSRRTASFRRRYDHLPDSAQEQAIAAYDLFEKDPHHPSLQFKRVHAKRPIYSVRIGLGYRAVGTVEGDTVVWYWIGTHAEYDKLLIRM